MVEMTTLPLQSVPALRQLVDVVKLGEPPAVIGCALIPELSESFAPYRQHAIGVCIQ
jgi:hypothetical protein